MNESICPICMVEQSLLSKPIPLPDKDKYECRICGKFSLSGTVRVLLKKFTAEDPRRIVLSYYIRRAHGDDREFFIDSNLLELLSNKELPSLDEQINNIIEWIAENSDPGNEIQIDFPFHSSVVGSKDLPGFQFDLEYLQKQGYISNVQIPSNTIASFRVKLTFKGWDYYAEYTKIGLRSRQVFMAMKYNDAELDKIYIDCIKPAIQDTGYELIRLDENAPSGLIDDRLMVTIRNCRFLIAEEKENNPGVYWEAGFAEGLGKPVIYTCMINSEDNTKPHFDTNHRLTIFWDPNNLNDFANKIKNTIRATFPEEAKMQDDM